MMDLFQSMSGMLWAEITCADIPGFLAAVCESGISLFHVQITGSLSAQFCFAKNDWTVLRKCAERWGVKLSVHRRRGIYWSIIRALNRPVLVIGLALILLMAAFLPTRILFIKVEGNDKIPTKLILEKAELCGITFGVSRRQIRSEEMKNNLLSKIPQLQWAGINTSGCTATISVEERYESADEQKVSGVSSIVAIRDGVVQSCTVTRGNALCRTGQAVKAGEVLVSGYVDCGIKIQATRAEAEIFAQTLREVNVVTPLNYTYKGEISYVEKKYSLIIGKKRINFYKDSGISDISCDKMYYVYTLSLPGGFVLPVKVLVERLTHYKNDKITAASDNAHISLSQFVNRYLPDQMISGKILERKESSVQLQDTLCLQGKYVCLEMIGQVQYEEIINSNGKND